MKPILTMTGAAGRVGRLLRPLLGQSYHLRLVDIADPEPTMGEECLVGDLADNTIAAAAVEGAQGVLHLAGLVGPDFDFETTLRPNYLAMIALLDACRSAATPRFIYASSHHAVGLHPAGDAPFEAATPLAPDGFYGLSKAFGEAACQLYARRFTISTLIIRIGNADPQVPDGRRERMWVSGRDLAQLVELGMTAKNLVCETVYGVSGAPSPLFSNVAAERLGYRPLDNSVDNHAAHYRPLATLTSADGVDWAGGFFAVAPLPRT